MSSKIMIKSLLVNLFLTILKLIGSIFSHSLTLMGDSIHCLSDMMTDIVGLLGSLFLNKKPNTKHPYGYGKIEYITSTIISIFIISLGFTIIINSFKGEITAPNKIGIIVIILSIIIKFTLSNYLLKKGHEFNSNILITNGTESKYDAYSSIFALIFMVISLFGVKYKILTYADLIGSLIISILTIKIGLTLLIQNTSCLISEAETDWVKIKEIKEIISHYKTVLNTKEVKLIKYGSYYSAVITITMNSNLPLSVIYIVEKEIKEELKISKLNIKYINLNYIPKSHVTS